MLPWDAIGNLVLGFWKSHNFQKWVRAWTSLILSGVLTFLFVWGVSIESLFKTVGPVGALILGFGLALIAAAGSILAIVRKVEQFKGIALFFPAGIEEAIQKMTKEGGTEFDPNLQKK